MLHRVGKSYYQIADQLEIPKLTVTKIIHRASRNPEQPSCKTKSKLNARCRLAPIRDAGLFPHDNLSSMIFWDGVEIQKELPTADNVIWNAHLIVCFIMSFMIRNNK